MLVFGNMFTLKETPFRLEGDTPECQRMDMRCGKNVPRYASQRVKTDVAQLRATREVSEEIIQLLSITRKQHYNILPHRCQYSDFSCSTPVDQ